MFMAPLSVYSNSEPLGLTHGSQLGFSVLKLHHSFVKLDKFLFYQYFKFVVQVCITQKCITIVTEAFTLNETQVLT